METLAWRSTQRNVSIKDLEVIFLMVKGEEADDVIIEEENEGMPHPEKYEVENICPFD